MESNVVHRSNWIRYSQWALGFNALGAAVGAWYLLGRPDPMPLTYLEGSPFSDYTGPGLILLVAVGGSSLLAAVAHWRRWWYAYLLTLAAGCILLGWLFFESVWIPEGWPAQLLFAAVAAVIVAGGYQGWQDHASQTA